MNDFDFEELDKAVNNLATKVQDEHGEPVLAQNSTPRENVSTPSSVPANAKPVTVSDPTPMSTPTTPAEPPAVTSTSAPAKHRLSDTPRSRRGAFMDIVPPSPRKTPTRVGVSVQPVSKLDEVVPEQPEAVKPEAVKAPESKAEAVAEPPVVPTPTERSEPTPAKSVEPRPEPADAPQDVAWPDPLDFNDAPSKPAGVEPEPTEPVSPFLAEAKVEKRPLGAFSNFKPADEPKPEPPKPVDEKPKKSEDELTPQTDGTFEEPEKQKAPLPPKEGEKPEEKEPAKPDLHGTAMMAIPDQYRPEPKATDKTARPVYDTKEYHPPLVEAASHEHRGGGSMWGKIFVALVALALIAVAGYFAYIYLMQR